MALLLKGARLIDPQVGLDEVADVLLSDGRIEQIGSSLSLTADETRDLSGKILLPGLVDMHVHLRDPGFEYKEDVASGTRAAAHGGLTTVCAMPNTDPVIDNGAAVRSLLAQADAVGRCRVVVAGACTQGEKGLALSEMGDMDAAGVCAYSDDGHGIQSSGMMRRVMEYAYPFHHPILAHCQDDDLVGEGQVNEGVVSTRLGLFGWPAEGEEVEIARDIALCRLTGTALHIQHISTERGLNLVRAAKAEGLPVTCEVTPHHLFLSEDLIGDDYPTAFKVNPPLRTQADCEALLAGLAAGDIDAIASDHAPHAAWEKDREFELAPFGMIGLETTVGLVLTRLLQPGLITYNQMVELMAVNPRRILGLEPISLCEGSTADLTIIDPDESWVVSEDRFYSKASNSAFIGWELTGRATDVYVGGFATMEDGVVIE